MDNQSAVGNTNDPFIRNQELNNWEFETKQIELKSYPVDIIIPFTTFCNAKCRMCTFCSNKKYTLKPEDIDEYKEILPFVVNLGYSCYGEPLLNPYFSEIAEKIYTYLDKRATSYLVTNGIFLGKRIDIIKQYIKSINISLNAATPETHKKVMGLNGNNFEEIIDHIKELVTYRDAYDRSLQIHISFVVNQLNIKEAVEFIELGENIGVDTVYLNTLAINSRKKFLSETDIRLDYYELLHPTQDSYFNKYKTDINKKLNDSRVKVICNPESIESSSFFEDYADTTIDNYECNYLYKRLLIINEENLIKPCCYMNSVPGFKGIHLNTENFYKTWNSPQFKYLRRSLKEKKPSQICIHCLSSNKNLFNKG